MSASPKKNVPAATDAPAPEVEGTPAQGPTLAVDNTTTTEELEELLQPVSVPTTRELRQAVADAVHTLSVTRIDSAANREAQAAKRAEIRKLQDELAELRDKAEAFREGERHGRNAVKAAKDALAARLG